jgi:hypothetical protein
MTVTREMISAAHREAMKNGDVILSAELLTRIYEAMAARKPRVTWACPVCCASVDAIDAGDKNDGT